MNNASLDDFFPIDDDMNLLMPLREPDHLWTQGPAATGDGALEGPSSVLDPAQPPDLAGCPIDWRDVDASLASSIMDSPYDSFEPSGSSIQQEDARVPSRSVDTTHIIDDFFTKNGASRPPEPCTYCKRFRLQCLILQTTSANPNPKPSCSSCVALFRECSLSGWSKRDPSQYESRHPVIGQLHGVSEDGSSFTLGDTSAQFGNSSTTLPTPSSKRSHTRSVKKTRVLRNWFACHLDHPYPSEEEKTALAQQSGLSRVQVINWFANTRRRHRMSSNTQYSSSSVFRNGSPMPQPLTSNLSPLERWRFSPPDQEPASASAIEIALDTPLPTDGSSFSSLDHGNNDGFASSTSGESFFYPNPLFHDASSNSGSSCYSHRSNDFAGAFSHSGRSSLDGTAASWTRGRKPKTTTAHPFQCTFCKQGFKKKYDWLRHERSVHLPGLDSWICSLPLERGEPSIIWRVNQITPECVFCGQDSPTDEHVSAHEFETCEDRPVADRTFTRKDHLWQHLQKFHGCRKWEGWRPDLALLQRRQDAVRSRCGFCQASLESWDERGQHIAGHFRAGMTMDEWTGGSGIEDWVP